MYTHPVADELGIRALRADLAAAVRRAEAGERIVVTVGSRRAAVLGPLEPVGTRTIADLVDAGQVEPPRRHDSPGPPGAVDVPVDVRLDRVLDEIRGR